RSTIKDMGLKPFLGGEQGHVRVLPQLIDTFAVERIESHAQGRVCFDGNIGKQHRFGQALVDLEEESLHLRFLIDLRQKDGKFVTAQGRHSASIASRIAQTFSYTLQQEIAIVMPQRVVDVAKVVEVHQQ